MDPSASQGGDIGWISKTQLEEPLKQVVLETPVGAIAKNPIKVGPRWHLVKVVNHREGRPASFEASQDRMKSSLLVKLRNNYVQELRENQTKINR